MILYYRQSIILYNHIIIILLVNNLDARMRAGLAHGIFELPWRTAPLGRLRPASDLNDLCPA